MLRHRFARARRVVVYMALAALFAVLSLTLAQCTMVGDSLTGVKASTFGATSCVGTCRTTYHNALSAARKAHQAIMSACNSLSTQAEIKACKDAENTRWNNVQLDLKTKYDACVASCHKQGAGFGG